MVTQAHDQQRVPTEAEDRQSGPPLPADVARVRSELAELATALAKISRRFDQDCGTAQMVMAASARRHGRSELLSGAAEPILSASLFYAAGDLDQVYPRIAKQVRAIKALAEKYGS